VLRRVDETTAHAPLLPWKGGNDVENTTLEWLDWFNHRRLLEPIGDIPPAEYDAAYWAEKDCEETKGLRQPSLRYTAVHPGD
jgi:hypothetical protein